MHRGTDADPGLGREAGREPHHFRAVRLHREVPKRARIGIPPDADRPPEFRLQPVAQEGVVHRGVGPGPKPLEGSTVEVQQLPTGSGASVGPLADEACPATVLHRQHGRLAQVADGAVRLLRAVGWDQTGCFPNAR